MLFYGWTLHIFYLICNFCTKQPSCSPGADGPSIHILGVRPHKMCQMLRIIPKHKCPSNKETDLLFRAYVTWRWGTNVFTTFQSRNCKVPHALPKEGGGGVVWRHARPETFFSWSIPPKLENKLHRHKQRFGKIVRRWGCTPGNSWWGVPPSSPNPALFQTKICHQKLTKRKAGVASFKATTGCNSMVYRKWVLWYDLGSIITILTC